MSRKTAAFYGITRIWDEIRKLPQDYNGTYITIWTDKDGNLKGTRQKWVSTAEMTKPDLSDPHHPWYPICYEWTPRADWLGLCARIKPKQRNFLLYLQGRLTAQQAGVI